MIVGQVRHWFEGGIIQVDIRRPNNCPSSFSLLFDITELTEDGRVYIFNTEEELDKWVEWIETPDGDEKKPKIVKLRKDDGK